MQEYIKKGEPLELIDGDNLNFNEKTIESFFDEQFKMRVKVVSVLGPQSSGKSTLLNYLFGCRFYTSAGRCTSGVYISFIKASAFKELDCDYLAILDTEGLQSPEKVNKEFDRKITLFTLTTSHSIIINIKGEMKRDMN
jgi:GTPase Era involved in 16S rRNA processing